MWRTAGLLLALTAALAAAPAAVRLPRVGDALPLAAADLARRPADAAYLRYLWLGQTPAGPDRERIRAAVDVAANGVSRRPLLRRARPVDPAGALVALDLRDYQWDAAFWDRLVLAGSGPNPRHEPYLNREVPPKNPANRFRLVSGAWLPPEALQAAAKLAGTDDPVLRADWFVSQVSTTPAYYQFLGLKAGDDLAAWQKVVRADPGDTAKDLEVRAALVRSGVALHNRVVEFWPHVRGGYWRSYDFAKSTDEASIRDNPLVTKSDAGEHIAGLPNGLHGYALTDGAERLVDAADAEKIARDLRRVSQSPVIRSGRSCAGCHGTGTNDGMWELADRFRQVVAVRPLADGQILLTAAKERDARKVGEVYGRAVGPELKRTREAYREAVREATGLTVRAATEAYERVAVEYAERFVTRADAARELGVTEAELVAALKRGVNLKGALAEYLTDPPGENPRDAWEQVFAEAAELVIALEAMK